MNIRDHIHYDPATGAITNHSGEVLTVPHPRGYLQVRLPNRKLMLAHRAAWLYMTGELPKTVDHKNTVRTDNRWDNLRTATYGQNNLNIGVRKDSRSGIKGVSLHAGGLWRVRYMAKGKRQCHYFEDIELAELVASEARKKYHGEFARD